MMRGMNMRSVKYRWVERGFFRIKLFGLQWRFYNSARRFVPFSGRNSGWWLGRFCVHVGA
jgi:hypothetical protein